MQNSMVYVFTTIISCVQQTALLTKSMDKSAKGGLNTIDNYAKDGGPGVVCPSCSVYHDPLRY